MLDFELYGPYQVALFVELFFWVFLVSIIFIGVGFSVEAIVKRVGRRSGPPVVSSRRPEDSV